MTNKELIDLLMQQPQGNQVCLAMQGKAGDFSWAGEFKVAPDPTPEACITWIRGKDHRAQS